MITYSETAVDGKNVCATCPNKCCSGCQYYVGWIGDGQHSVNKHLPSEFFELFKLRDKFYDQDNLSIVCGVFVKKIDMQKFVNDDEFKRIFKELEKKLGYSIQFSAVNGFLTENGCSLKREHRSYICNHAMCSVLKKSIKDGSTDKTYGEISKD